jgi:hypothetical protein
VVCMARVLWKEPPWPDRVAALGHGFMAGHVPRRLGANGRWAGVFPGLEIAPVLPRS